MAEVTILTDKNSYLNSYLSKFQSAFEKIGYAVNFINDTKDLPKDSIVFILSYYKIIEEDILKTNKHNIVIHESDLPKGRGWSPASYTILNGDNRIVLTLFEADKECDNGKIYLKDHIELSGDELVDNWRELVVLKKIDMCAEFLSKLEFYEQHAVDQTEIDIAPSYYRKRTQKDCELDINKSLKDQFNLLRIVDNESYPAFFHIGNKKFVLKIYEAEDSH